MNEVVASKYDLLVLRVLDLNTLLEAIGTFQRGSQRTDQEPTKESHLKHLTSFITSPLYCECSCWSWESHRRFNFVQGCLWVATIGSFEGFGCEDGEELKTDCDNVRLWMRFSSFVMEIFGDYLNWSAADPAMIAFVRRSLLCLLLIWRNWKSRRITNLTGCWWRSRQSIC